MGSKPTDHTPDRPAGQRRGTVRMHRIELTDEAWTALRIRAVERNMTLQALMGEILSEATMDAKPA